MATNTTKKAGGSPKKAARTVSTSAKRTVGGSAKQATGATKTAAKKAGTASSKAGRTAKQTAKKASAATKQTAKKAAGTATKTTRAASSAAPSLRRSSRSSGQDAIALLKSDHRNVDQLFEKFEGLGATAHRSRETTVAKIIEALARHAAVEEEILYPEVRGRVKGREDQDLVLEALEEHHIVKWTLSELQKMSSPDERYTAKVTVLAESVRHHVEEEENELFPKVRDLFTKSELDDMGERLAQAKKTAPTRPHPHAPDEPPGNIIANALVAPLDATAAVAGGVAKAVRRAVR